MPHQGLFKCLKSFYWIITICRSRKECFKANFKKIPLVTNITDIIICNVNTVTSKKKTSKNRRRKRSRKTSIKRERRNHMLCKAAQPSFIQPLAPCSSKVCFLLVPACDKSSTVGGGALTPPSGIQGRERQSLISRT